jgi:1-acyl-sn-glycerol-3-phosphate acyltransferase
MISFYRIFKWFVRFTLKTYFRKIKFEGFEQIPVSDPVIYACNHQNAFLDALIIGAFSPRDTHFITRADVFVKWSIPILKALKMIPIYRIRDGYTKLGLNQATFSSCKEILREKGAILIFSEGNHGEHYYLRPITKGTAKLAFFSNQPEQNIKIVPVGINYFSHTRPRTFVLVAIGNPISVSDFQTHFDANPAAAILNLRNLLAKRMKDTLVIPEKTENYEMKKVSIFREGNRYLALKELRALEVTNSPKAKQQNHILAKIFNPIPFFIIHRVLVKVEDIVFHSSLKFAIGVFVFPVYWILVFTIMSQLINTQMAFLSLVVMISSLFYSYQ